jgi:hypothetical protein
MSEPTPSWLQDIREGYGDQRALENQPVADNDNNFWAKAFPAPIEPSYADVINDTLYRDSNRERGLPGALPDEWIAAYNGSNRGPVHNPKLYEQPAEAEAVVKTAPQSPLMPKKGETAQNYKSRFEGFIVRHLETQPAELRAALEAAYAESAERVNAGLSHEELRAQIDSRSEGTGIGLLGRDSKQLVTELAAREAATAASYRSNDYGYEAISTTVPRVDLFAARQAESAKQAAAVQARYAHGDLRPSGI